MSEIPRQEETESFINPIEINHETFMRGEPIAAMDFTLINGLRPEKHRQELGQLPKERDDNNIHKSHRPDRVSLGKGNLIKNAASMEEFGGEGNVIYIIDKQIEQSKTFRPNSEHPNNAEFLIKGVGSNAIKGIIVHNKDMEKVKTRIQDIKKSLYNKINLGDKDIEELKKKITLIDSLSIISFEDQMEKEKNN